MCLAVPVRVLEIDGERALVELGTLAREVSLALVPETRVGDYVLLHAGFAIQTVDEKEAAKPLRLFDELAAAAEEQAEVPGGDVHALR